MLLACKGSCFCYLNTLILKRKELEEIKKIDMEIKKETGLIKDLTPKNVIIKLFSSLMKLFQGRDPPGY